MYDNIIATCTCGHDQRGLHGEPINYECQCGKTVRSRIPFLHICFIMLICTAASYFYLALELPSLFAWWKPLALGAITGSCVSFLWNKLKSARGRGYYIYKKSRFWAFLCRLTCTIASFTMTAFEWLIKILTTILCVYGIVWLIGNIIHS